MSAEQFFDELRRLQLDPAEPLVLQAIRTVDEIIDNLTLNNDLVCSAWNLLSQEEKDKRRLASVYTLITNIPTYQRQ